MGLYAYCVVPAAHRPPSGLVGITGAPVELLQLTALGVWISPMERPQVSVEAVQAHNRVVEVAITEQVTPVPLRFGQWLGDAPGLIAAISEQSAQYGDRLRRFAGCLEFGLRVIDPTAVEEAQEVRSSTVTSGRAYMQALRESSKLSDQKKEFADSVGARVRELMQDVVREERVEAASTRHAVLTLAHLVSRDRFDEYRERARQIRSIFPALRLLLSGPWPPYSFAA